MQSFVAAETLDNSVESWSYEEICSKSFRYVFPADQFQYNEETGEYVDLTEEELGLRTLYNNGLEIRIVGIIRQNSDALAGMLTGSVGYTHALVEYLADECVKKDLIMRQLEDPEHDVFNGLPYLDKDDEAMTKSKKAEAAKEYIEKASIEEIAELYITYMCEPDDAYLQKMLDEQMGDTSREEIEKTILEYYPEYASMLDQMDDETLFSYMRQMAADQVRTQYAQQMKELYSQLSDEELAEDFSMLSLEEDDYIWIYDNAMPPVYSTSTLKETLKKLGYVDLDNPSAINIYASSFENKDRIAEEITKYNESVPEEDQIHYTDMVALLMSSITTIINVISYVLIAFVAISLVVSSIMIGIITYISVLERTKEIGILRAIGASKRDVSRVFNAETFIIGLTSGVIGIVMTLLLNIPINIIVHDLTKIQALNSQLPLAGAAGLVVISVILTYIAGLIPSGLAAKKDPVEALRTE
jgi:putative ABC transport system permease protein